MARSKGRGNRASLKTIEKSSEESNMSAELKRSEKTKIFRSKAISQAGNIKN